MTRNDWLEYKSLTLTDLNLEYSTSANKNVR